MCGINICARWQAFSMLHSIYCWGSLVSTILFFALTGPVYAYDHLLDRTPTYGPYMGTATAAELAAAMDIPASDIVSASLGTSDSEGAAVFISPLGGFPTQGGSFAAISSGAAANASLPNNTGSLSTVLGGLNNSQGNDLFQLTLTLNVPPGVAFWAVDWKFFSEEFPEFVGSIFNDAFFIETPTSNIVIVGNVASSDDNNVAFDPSGEPVTINTTGAVGMTAANAAETTYDGATTTLTTAAPIPPGAATVTIIFSVTDLGDSIFDTTIFLDNFRFVTVVPPQALPPLIKVPIRWCAIGIDDDGDGTIDRGAPSIVDPGLVGESSVKDVLWRRHERVSDNIYIPQANMTFRSGATAAAPDFPIIPDPRFEPDGTAGEYGDIVYDRDAGDTIEFYDVR